MNKSFWEIELLDWARPQEQLLTTVSHTITIDIIFEDKERNCWLGEKNALNFFYFWALQSLHETKRELD